MFCSIQVPRGCKETGDCMIVPAPGFNAIPGKTYEDEYHTDMAIDALGNKYVIDGETDDGDPIFTPENEWEPVDPSAGQYEGDGKFAANH